MISNDTHSDKTLVFSVINEMKENCIERIGYQKQSYQIQWLASKVLSFSPSAPHKAAAAIQKERILFIVRRQKLPSLFVELSARHYPIAVAFISHRNKTI